MQRHHILMRIFLFITIALHVTCGRRESTSSLSYISWGTSSVKQSTIAKSRNEAINVCLKGSVSSSDLERAKAWARRAILTWLRIGKNIDDSVTSKVSFSCTDVSLTINLRNGSGTSFASPSVATIYTTRPYGTWTHEFGHALAGLSDTYASGAGKCKSGQPQSLMCWGAYGPRANPDQFSTLWQDDIEGFAANYAKVFPGEYAPPDWSGAIDLEAPLDPNAAWPGAEAPAFSTDAHEETLVEIDETLGPSEIDYDPNTPSVDL